MAFDRKKLEWEVLNKISEMSPKLCKNFDIKDTKEWKDEIKKLRKKVDILGDNYDYLLIDIENLEDPFYGLTPEEFDEIEIN